jgi:hypothetical protein
VHIYIVFETLKVKCTQYGICSQAAFKNARAIFFFSGGAGNFFRADLKKSRAGAEISREGCPRPDLTSLKVCVGGGETLTSPAPTHLHNHVVWSRAMKGSVKSYVTGSSTECYFNEFLFIQVLTHDLIK